MAIQPYIDTIVQALVGLLAAAVLAWVAVARKRVEAWLEARTTVQQRAALHKLAAEAVAYVEASAGSPGARNKLQQATEYVNRYLPDPVKAVLASREIQAAIEKALYEMKAGAFVTPAEGQHGPQ